MRTILPFIALMLLAGPAHAGQPSNAATLEMTALICQDPASGEEIAFKEPGLRHLCPPGHTEFPVYEVEKAPGADPAHEPAAAEGEED